MVGGVESAELNLAYTTYTASSVPAVNSSISTFTSRSASAAEGRSPTSETAARRFSPWKRKKEIPFLPAMCISVSTPRPRRSRTSPRASRIRLALKPPARPRLEVSRSTAARRTCSGCRSSG